MAQEEFDGGGEGRNDIDPVFVYEVLDKRKIVWQISTR